jgi:hypothetical protein
METVVILATGVYVMWGGVMAAHYPMNVPHPVGQCEQERQLSQWARRRIQGTLLTEIPAMLERENLGTTDPEHDWCAPRYWLRKTVGPEVPIYMGPEFSQYARLPPRRVY